MLSPKKTVLKAIVTLQNCLKIDIKNSFINRTFHISSTSVHQIKIYRIKLILNNLIGRIGCYKRSQFDCIKMAVNIVVIS